MIRYIDFLIRKVTKKEHPMFATRICPPQIPGECFGCGKETDDLNPAGADLTGDEGIGTQERLFCTECFPVDTAVKEVRE